MQHVMIIGANGRTAREIIPRLQEQIDVKLTLFLRQAERVQDKASQDITIVDGDARNIEELKAALKGQDIVINAMGGMDLGDTTETLGQAMTESGVKRIIAINAGGIYDELPEPFNTWDFEMVGSTRPINLKAAEAIEHSSLDYTILRPVWLTNKPITDVQLTDKGEMYKGTETSRASLAQFISEIVENPERYKNENVGISQPNTDGDKPAAFR
ncbi:SDR family oxidoreductase [Oceanobacillus locisalsi]|uniref:SDR family oxidoreductase n=1 Tax=Oceanobacillus locisalsi TaxID=546107 RepID=A0ABW3NJ67_9BACI